MQPVTEELLKIKQINETNPSFLKELIAVFYNLRQAQHEIKFLLDK